MNWDWSFALHILPQLLSALVLTLEISLLGSVLALVLGLVFALCEKSSTVWLRRGVSWSTEFIRRTPLLVQLYFLFYVLPEAGILLSALEAGILGIGLHFAAYTAEVYRGGINALPKGQWDAAKACNLSAWQTWRYIILPQAVRPSIPALASLVIALFKATPLLSALGLIEVMGRAREIANLEYRYLEPMTMVGLLFLLISLPAAVTVRYLESNYGAE